MKEDNKIETIWNKVKNLKYKTHDDKLGPIDKDYSQLKNARILTPEEVEKLGYGTCYDQANYVAYLADKLNLEYVIRFTLYSKGNEYTSHLCTYVKDIQGWYWIESAWSKMKGVHGPEKDINVFNKLADKEQGDFHLINENIDMANKLKPYWNDKRFTMDKFNDITNKVSTEGNKVDVNYFISIMKEIGYDEAAFSKVMKEGYIKYPLRSVEEINRDKIAVCLDGSAYLAIIAREKGCNSSVIFYKYISNKKIWWHTSPAIEVDGKWCIIDWPNNIKVTFSGKTLEEAVYLDMENYLSEDDWVCVEAYEVDYNKIKNKCTVEEFLSAVGKKIGSVGELPDTLPSSRVLDKIHNTNLEDISSTTIPPNILSKDEVFNWLYKDKTISLEAAGSNKRRETEAFILKYITKILPSSKSVEIYKALFKQMNDKAFDRWMCDLRDGKNGLVIICPNFRNKHISVENNLKIGRELGHEFFQRLHIGPRGNNPGYLTPIKYLIVDLPARRAAQSLIKKISISDSNKGVDKLSGQLVNTKDTKSARLTHPELQLLVSMGLDATLLELMKYRGGDIGGFRAMNLMISKYGHANLGVLNQYTTGVESTKTLSSYLRAMHLKNNLADK